MLEMSYRLHLAQKKVASIEIKHSPPQEPRAMYGSFCIYCHIKHENVSEIVT